jgi:hypothetical protein
MSSSPFPSILLSNTQLHQLQKLAVKFGVPISGFPIIVFLSYCLLHFAEAAMGIISHDVGLQTLELAHDVQNKCLILRP